MSNRPDQILAGRWQLDPQRSSVEFRVKTFWGLVTVKGHFDDYEGRLDLNGEPAIALTIASASLQTGNGRRDRHLRSADFFDAENRPWVRFVSDSVVLQGDTLKVRGRLFARDRSIPLELDARVRPVGEELEIEAVTAAAHRDLGMSWSPLGIISPRSELLVNGSLVRGTEDPGGEVMSSHPAGASRPAAA